MLSKAIGGAKKPNNLIQYLVITAAISLIDLTSNIHASYAQYSELQTIETHSARPKNELSEIKSKIDRAFRKTDTHEYDQLVARQREIWSKKKERLGQKIYNKLSTYIGLNKKIETVDFSLEILKLFLSEMGMKYNNLEIVNSSDHEFKLRSGGEYIPLANPNGSYFLYELINEITKIVGLYNTEIGKYADLRKKYGENSREVREFRVKFNINNEGYSKHIASTIKDCFADTE
jgi:hypothetical protein